MMSAERKLESISYDWDRAPIICELNGYRWLLGPEFDEAMTWGEAMGWCIMVAKLLCW